jgi:hypothetical protein
MSKREQHSLDVQAKERNSGLVLLLYRCCRIKTSYLYFPAFEKNEKKKINKNSFKQINNNVGLCMDTLLACIVSGVCLQLKSLLTTDESHFRQKLRYEV